MKKSSITEIAKRTYNSKDYGNRSYSEWKWLRKPHTKSIYNQTKFSIESTLDRKGLNCLEIGIGDGIWTELLLKREFNVDGIDISTRMLDMAKERLGNRINYILADFNEVILKNKYDLIYSIRCIEYIDDKKKAINKIYNLLNHSGKVIIVTKNPSFIAIKWQDRDMHKGQIYSKDLKILMHEAGFKDIKVIPAVFGKGIHFAFIRKFNETILKKLIKTKKDIFVLNPLIESYLIIGEKK